jgi:23S rRNA (adenine2503-C2)-methyltransferase
MRIIAKTGTDDLATVYIARSEKGELVEFAESVQPPYPREKKWVLTVSTLFGCPIGCRFCDAGGGYKGKLSAEEIFSQIDYPVRKYYPDGIVPTEKFKIQFARMGEPSLNSNLLDLLEILPESFDAPGMIISLSTVAPQGTEPFFARLFEIKERHYVGKFQLQFSVHSTDLMTRSWLIPAKTWSLPEMARYGENFRRPEDRKITLNFAMARNIPVEPKKLLEHFSPEDFLIKITPVNPTERAMMNHLSSAIEEDCDDEIVSAFLEVGYETILSIGERRENLIGSNCGQYINRLKSEETMVPGAYESIFEQIAEIT